MTFPTDCNVGQNNEKGPNKVGYLRLEKPRQAVNLRLGHDAGLCSAVVVVVVEILRRMLLLLHFGSLYTSAK